MKRGKNWGETVETSIEIIKTLGETCGNTMGNGRKWLGNWGIAICTKIVKFSTFYPETHLRLLIENFYF